MAAIDDKAPLGGEGEVVDIDEAFVGEAVIGRYRRVHKIIVLVLGLVGYDDDIM